MSTLLYWAPLWIPLLLVPVLIIVVRMLIYGYRLLLVKKYGYEASELPDPLEALGLDLRRNYQNTHGIRQLKKAQDKFAKRPETPHVEKKHGMWIRSPAVVEIQRQYKRNFSSEAIRAWYTTSFWARAWLVFQVSGLHKGELYGSVSNPSIQGRVCGTQYHQLRPTHIPYPAF